VARNSRAPSSCSARPSLETIAEGIENEDQVATLLDLGCVAGQGFLFASSCSLKIVAATEFMSRRASLRAERAAPVDSPPPAASVQPNLWPRSAAG